MPVFDTERQSLVVRVVFDGPAFAGKTTNLQQITTLFPVQKRTEMYTPGALKGRTMFFDWLEVEAGRVAGYPLRCQLLTVPGQGERSYRRKPLLESADGVVFVCDSSRASLPDTRRMFAQLKTALRRRRPRHIPVVLQANKQDAPDRLSVEELSHALRLDPAVSVMPAVAHEGAGVRETIVAAIKIAVREVQQFVAQEGLESITGAPETSDELLDALLALEDDESLQVLRLDIDAEDEIAPVDEQAADHVDAHAEQAGERVDGQAEARAEPSEHAEGQAEQAGAAEERAEQAAG